VKEREAAQQAQRFDQAQMEEYKQWWQGSQQNVQQLGGLVNMGGLAATVTSSAPSISYAAGSLGNRQ